MRPRNRQATPRLKALALALMACLPCESMANPTDPHVVAGSAGFHASGSTLTVTNSPGTVIDWGSFSISAGETTRFIQSSAASQVLNRVTGGDPSLILGTLQSNGRVFLLNPGGIAFGPGAVVDVAGLVASSLSLSVDDFRAGRYAFAGDATLGAVRNMGTLRTGQGGSVALIAPSVENHGLIHSPEGSVILAAGHRVTLVDSHRPDVRVELTAPQGSAVNVGELVSRQVGIYAGAIRHEGVTSATTAEVGAGGTVVFRATGAANVAGRVEATGQVGGRISVTAPSVEVGAGARLDASGQTAGGTVLVGGGFRGADNSISNAVHTRVAAGALLLADATRSGQGGTVVVWADDRTAFAGRASARGGQEGGSGGLVEVSGRRHLDYRGLADTRAPLGRNGRLLLDPGAVVIGFSDPQTGASFVDVNVLADNLGTGDVTIATTDPGVNNPLAETITLLVPLSWTSGRTLTLQAGSAITLGASVSMPGGALVLDAPAASASSLTLTGGRLSLVNTSTANPGTPVLTTNDITLEGMTLAGSVVASPGSRLTVVDSLGFDNASVLLQGGSLLYRHSASDGRVTLTAAAQGRTGEVVFGVNPGFSSTNRVYTEGAFALFVGPGITFRSDSQNPGLGEVLMTRTSVTAGDFRGQFDATAPGLTYALTGTGTQGWSNAGTISVSNGATLLIGGSFRDPNSFSPLGGARWTTAPGGSLVLGGNSLLEIEGGTTTATLRALSRSAGAGTLRLNSEIDNRGDVLNLTAAGTGTLEVGTSGRVTGGTLGGEPGLFVIGSSAQPALDGVTLTTRINVPANSVLRILNGLVLDGGSVRLAGAKIQYEGSQSISSPTSGEILFASPTATASDTSAIEFAGTQAGQASALTIGPRVTIRSDPTNPGGGTVNLSASTTERGRFDGTLLASGGRGFTVTASRSFATVAGWTHGGTLAVADAGSTLRLSGDWDVDVASPGTLILSTGATLNLAGRFPSRVFSNLDRSAGAGTLQVIGEVANTNAVLTLDASTGPVRVTNVGGASGSIVGGRIAGEDDLLELALGTYLDQVTLASRVQVQPGSLARLRNGLTFDGGFLHLSSGARLIYEGAVTFSAGPGGGGVLYSGPTSSLDNAVQARTTGDSLAVGAGVVFQPLNPTDTSTSGMTLTLTGGGIGTTTVMAGTVRATSGQLVSITGGGSAWSNSGLIEADGGQIRMFGAAVTNDPTGVMRVTGTGSLSVATGSTPFVNSGRVDLGSNGGFSAPGADFVNAQGAVLTGRGSINLIAGSPVGTLVNRGTIFDGTGTSRIDLSGNLRMESTGVLAAGIGGTVAGDGFDQLLVSGLATINVGASLSATLLNGFSPAGGELFEVLRSNLTDGTLVAGNLSQGLAIVSAGTGTSVRFGEAAPITCLGTICWDGGASSTAWTDAANWTGDRLPGLGDIVVVDVPGAAPVSLSGGAHSILSLTLRELLTINGGSLAVTGSASLAAPVTISGGTLRLQGASSASSAIQVSGGTLEALGAFSATASITLSAGVATFGAETTLVSFVQTGGTSNFNGTTTIVDLTHGGGDGVTLQGSGQVTVTGVFQWRDEADLRGTGLLVTAGSTTLTGSTGLGFGLVKPWENRGAVTMTSGAHVHFATEVAAGRLVNTSTGSINLDGAADTPFDVFSGSGYEIVNAGTISRTAPGTQTIGAGITLVNTGVLNLLGGTLAVGDTFPANAGVVALGAATLRTTRGLTNTGTISGTGTLDLGGATLVNEGTLAPGGAGEVGTLGIVGALVQSGTARVQLDTGGPGGPSDLLSVTGQASFAGVLSLDPVGGYQPVAGDTLPRMINYASAAGAFASRTLAGGSGLTLNTSLGADTVIFTLVDGACLFDVCWIAGSGDWGSGSNWSTGLVPAAGQRVRVSAAGDQTITISAGTHAAGAITADEALVVSGGNITVGGNSSFAGPVTITGGLFTLAAAGSFTQLTLTGGRMALATGATATVTEILQASQAFALGGTGTLLIASGATANLVGPGSPPALEAGVTLENRGTLTVSAVTVDASLLNRGSLTASAAVLTGNVQNLGTFALTGDSTHSGTRFGHEGGTLSISEGTSLDKSQGAFAWEGGVITGGGTLNVRPQASLGGATGGNRVLDNASVQAPSLQIGAGTLSLIRGSLAIAGETRFTGNGTLSVQGGTATLSGPAIIANLSLGGGLVSAGGGLTVGTLAQSGGQLTGAGSLRVTRSLQRSGGQFQTLWQSIDITHDDGDLVIDVPLNSASELSARASSGRLRVLASLASGGDTVLDGAAGVDVQSAVQADGALLVRSALGDVVVSNTLATAGGTATLAAGGRVKVMSLGNAAGFSGLAGTRVQAGGDLLITAGDAGGASARLGGFSGVCSGAVGGSVIITGGSGNGAFASLAGGPDIGSASQPFQVGSEVRITSGAGAGSFARMEAGAPTTIHLQFTSPGSWGYQVDGQRVVALGQSGFFADGAPAVPGVNFLVSYAVTTLPTVVEAFTLSPAIVARGIQQEPRQRRQQAREIEAGQITEVPAEAVAANQPPPTLPQCR